MQTKKSAISLVGLVLMFLPCMKIIAQQRDPDNPTSQYVLAKLNDHLIVNAQNMDHIDSLEKRVGKLEGQNLNEHLVRIDATLETLKWMLMTGVGGIVTLLLKEIIPAWLKRNRSNS